MESVLEAVAEGTLHVARVAETDQAPRYYAISLCEVGSVRTQRVRVSPALEGAWSALFDDARRVARADPRFVLLPPDGGRPLRAMRDIGVDLRGIEGQ